MSSLCGLVIAAEEGFHYTVTGFLEVGETPLLL